MKVNFDAQVLSDHIAKHLISVYGEEVMETATFITHMNKWFDYLIQDLFMKGRKC